MLYDHDYQILRTRLKAMRHSAGLSQVELAKRLGKGQSYVSKIERGEQFVDVLEFVCWCEACGSQPGAEIAKIRSTQSGS
jgi:transcriptional regulator with XRE-family HTH domain